MKTNQIKFFILLCFAFFILSNSYGFSYKKYHEFEIYRNAKKIGFHKLYFQKTGNKIEVNTQIEMIVKLGFLTIFKYFHNYICRPKYVPPLISASQLEQIKSILVQCTVADLVKNAKNDK